jgi:hypothetical protein
VKRFYLILRIPGCKQPGIRKIQAFPTRFSRFVPFAGTDTIAAQLPLTFRTRLDTRFPQDVVLFSVTMFHK